MSGQHEFSVLVLKFVILEFEFNSMSVLEFALVLIHECLELDLPAWLEVEFWIHDDRVWDVGKIEKDHDHIRLLISDSLAFLLNFAIVVFDVTLIILNQLFSLINEGSDVIEEGSILWIGQNLIPWSALDGFLWNASLLELFNGIWIINADTEVILHVVVLDDELLGLRKSNGLEEVWKIFINLNFLLLKSESPFHQVVGKDFLDENKENGSHAHEKDWRCPVDSELWEVL
jgi:hypothetical protein